MNVVRNPNDMRRIASAADDLADEVSETDPLGLIAASLHDVSVSYLRGVQDALEAALGVWDGYPLPDELAVIYARAGVEHRVSAVST